MHYYQFNIADYRKDTGHLSPTEHYIYRTLIDWMYLDEQPIPLDIACILRRLGLPNDRLTDVEQVLNDFFTATDDGWCQERVLREIKQYNTKVESASRAGRASAKARKHKASERPLNDRSTNHKPLTNNHKPIKKGGFTPPAEIDVDYYMEIQGVVAAGTEAAKFCDFYASKDWMVGKTKMKDWKAAARNWVRRNANGKDKQFTSKSDRHDEAARKYAATLSEGDDVSVEGIGGNETPY